VIHYLEAERHSAYEVFLKPGNGGYPRGQFYAGLDAIDPQGTLGFEEVLIALRRRLRATHDSDPCYITDRVLQMGCARLLWCIQNSIWKVSACYEAFCGWLQPLPGTPPGAIISFNWDLLVERALTDMKISWQYSVSNGGTIPILKPHGSINWSRHLREELLAQYGGWQPIGPGNRLTFDALEPLSNPNKQEINSNLRYMIYPGDPELPDDDPDLRTIWQEVSSAIQERDVIVFLGYSMPDYDSLAAKFFQSFAGKKRIEVYNPSREHLERFQRVLGSTAQLCELSFEGSPYARQRTV
jgi:hypothetical protein